MTSKHRVAEVVALLCVAGALGTLLDQIHVRSGTLSYPDPTALGQPWWVPVQFAILLTLVVLATLPLLALDRAATRVDARRLAIDLAWVVLAYCLSTLPALGVLPGAGGRAIVLLLSLTLAAVLLFRRGDARVVALALALAVLGPAYEALISSQGLFAYRDRDVVGVPMWLPGLYACAAPVLASVAAAFHAATTRRGWVSG